ncbi:hypothetical protein SAMN05519103_09019 [Rhizobiales bacterium GAS113]|nr:hypothetical protein SAMN05519103_09019 [Rhizobiales bacterium GAS113]
MAMMQALRAQTLTPDPGAWRPVAYADLQTMAPSTATYADIWKDAIEENNRAYLARGDTRFVSGYAPVTEAHFVIWSPTKSVVFSVLDTATGCTAHYVDRSVGAVVKKCPMRLAQYEGVPVRTLGGGKACFLEIQPPPGAHFDATGSAAYASYDIGTKTIRTGMIVNHKAVDGCSSSIPLYPQ